MPIVVSGTKTVRKSVGRVADFCPICHDLATFELFHIGFAAHVYGVALGDGDTMGYEAECEACRIVFSTHARRYARVAAEGESAEDVLRDCVPTRPEKINQQLAQAERLRAGELTPEERKTAMGDVFEFLNEYAKQRRAQATIDVKGKDGCVNSFLVFGVAYLAWYGWNAAFPKLALEGQHALMLFSAIILAGFVYTFWTIGTDTRRYVRAELLPKLTRALRLMSPSPDEIKALHERFAKRKFTLARNLSVEEIEQAVAGTASTKSEARNPK